MSNRFAAVLLASLSTIAISSSVQAAPAEKPSAAAQLKKLFVDSDEDNLRRNPISALFRGDLRYADRLGDYISDDYFAAERKASEKDLKRLNAIDRTALNATDQISYDVFKWQTDIALRGLQPDMLALTAVRPIDHFFGFHTFYQGTVLRCSVKLDQISGLSPWPSI